MMRRSNFLTFSPLFLLLVPFFQLSWVVGLGFTMLSSRAFNPEFKDSIYSPHFRRNTSLALLVASILEGITGFGAGPQTSNFISEITFGLLNRGLSLELHLALIMPLALLFVLHTVSGFGSLLLSKGVKTKWIYTHVIPIVWILMYLIAVYLDLEYFI